MLLAFRHKTPDSASWLKRLGAAVIRGRLVSEFYHGGVVIGDMLVHSTVDKGLHCQKFDPAGWYVIDVGSDLDKSAIEKFVKHKGSSYDWFSLLAFILPGRISDAKRWYCFEWQYYCLTGEIPTFRVTPEKIFTKLNPGVYFDTEE